MSRKGSRQASKNKKGTKGTKGKKVSSDTTAVETWLANRLRVAAPIGWVVCVLAVVVAGVAVLERMRDHVYAQPEYQTEPKLALDIPEQDQWVRTEGWESKILSAVALPEGLRSDELDLHDHVVKQLEASGWVSKVDRVVRDVDGTVRITCRYRYPVAMVEADECYFAVDREGYRLPGQYPNVKKEQLWIKLVGIQSPTPREGERYEGHDARSAIELAEAMLLQPYWRLIDAIDVSECGIEGRPGRDQIVVYFRECSRTTYVWGSPLGNEFEETTPEQRFQLLGRILATDLPEGEIDPTVYGNAVIIRRTAAEEAKEGLAHRDP